MLLVVADRVPESVTSQAHRTDAGTLNVTNARIIDGDGKEIAASGHIKVYQGRIIAIGPGPVEIHIGDPVVDLAGRTVMPGLVNAHGHVGDTRGLHTGAQFSTEENLLDQLRRYASYGVTTVVSLGGDGDAGFRLHDAQATSALDRARVFVAGPIVTAATATRRARTSTASRRWSRA